MSTTRRMRVASLCSRKRELTREGPLPLVAAPQAITQGPDAMVKKKKEGRPRELIRTRVREKRISFAVNEYEDMVISRKYRKAQKCAAEFCREALMRCDVSQTRYNSFLKDIDSLTHSEFCRMVTMSATMVEAITPEERHVILNLHKLGQRINQLFVQGKLCSHVDALAAYTEFMNDFADIKTYYQKRVRKL